MKFFVDNCLPPKMARAFDALAKPHHDFIHLKDHPDLKPNCTDIEWISLLANEGGWIVITKDKNIMKKPVEKAAFETAKLTGFFLDKTWSSFDFWTLLSKLAIIMPTIISLSESSSRGSCFKVPIRSKDIRAL